jgi:protein SCO1
MLDSLYQFLARMGFNEPLHPPITHMPIGLVTGVFIFFIIAVIFKKKNLVLTARHVSILAFIFAFPTIMLGVMDWIHFYHAAMITPIIIKMVLAVIVLVVLGTGIILGSEIRMHSMTMTVVYAMAFVAVIGLGYYGSGIIYGRGLSQRTDTVKKVKVVKHAALPSQAGPGIDEKPGNHVPLDLPFMTETGAGVRLRDVVKGPTILSLVYYKCPNACDYLLTSIAAVLRTYVEKPATGATVSGLPNLVTISIDENETAADAMKVRTIAFESIQKPYPADKWHFLTGPADSIKKITDAVGFRYVRKGGDFDHPIGLIILSPDGKVVRYLMGTDFLPVDLTMSLMQASGGIIRPTISRVLRYCFSIDPRSHRFVFNILRVSATVIFTLLGAFILYLVISTNKRRRKAGQR